MVDRPFSKSVGIDDNGEMSENLFDRDPLEEDRDPLDEIEDLAALASSPDRVAPNRPRGGWWNKLGFGSRLALLLIAGAAVPVIAVTQGIVWFSQQNAQKNLLATVKSNGGGFRDDYVLWQRLESVSQAHTIAKTVGAAKIDLQNPSQVEANRPLLETLLQPLAQEAERPDSWKSFRIITDIRGKTVAQYVRVLQDYPLGTSSEEVGKFLRSVSVPTGVELGEVPIVKASLTQRRPLKGIELVDIQVLQKLGLGQQLAVKPQSSGAKQAEGLVAMAVEPIKVNGKVVGVAIVGVLFDRGHLQTDAFTELYNAVAGIYARDLEVSSSVPSADGKNRLIGNRAPKEVTEAILNRGQEEFTGKTQIGGKTYLASFVPLYDHRKELNPTQAKPVGMIFAGTLPGELDETVGELQKIGYGIGGGIILLAGLAAIPIAGAFSRPLRRLSVFAQQIAAGQQGVRLDNTDRQDEIGILSQELNQMAASIESSMAEEQKEARSSQLLRDITLELGQYPQVDTAFSTVVGQLRQAIEADRVFVYRFDETSWIGTITAESVAEGWPVALGAQIEDHCFQQDYIEKYRQGRIWACDDVYAAGLQECHLKILEPFAVRANLVVPITRGSRQTLAGLLIAHQCSGPRAWQPFDSDLLVQVATQMGFALDRANLIELQRSSKELLQQRAIELLTEVDAIGKGDLTIRATVTEDAIGTIADSYNATVSSLRKIVTQVQTAAQKLTVTTSGNEVSVRELSQEALDQAEEINAALDRLQQMANSIQAVATSAEKAEFAVKEASQVVAESDSAMNRTVDGILAIRETVAQTSKKVKRLGESSQKISKVVNLISTFAEQTNLLALNAAIEAANAGEQGRGFAVVAERVRALARQSAQATAEIEGLVTEIQTETNEVVAAMEAGTEQVVTGTQLVDETKQSLTKITAVSAQIGALVDAIAQAAAAQSQTSETVTQTMSKVAAMSDKTLEEATQVSSSFKELLAVAEELQASASQFKVN
ncbi:MAG: cache domain-containing protein [Cyanosarcina radialis HA8281-LM2]|jgi:methyl-accepting chemotaxis protein PixJ|nr:cache domain-containing protein [Cyanosarcina radialis HA8281-LM2]